VKPLHIPSRRPAGATLQTSGELFPDGTALELARDPASGEFVLFGWDGSSLIRKRRFEHDGHTYIPLRVRHRLAQELFLPPRVARHKQTCQLLGELETLFRRSFNAMGHGATLLSLFVLASWIPELLPAAACIVVHGPFQEVTVLMRVLHSLCRHALHLGELDQHSFRNLPVEKLKPTLLVAQLAQDPKTTRLMHTSNARGLFTTCGKTGQDLFSCKVIYAGDAAVTLDGALDVTISPGQSAHMKSSEDLVLIADQFQPKLLGYRFASAGRKVPMSLDPAWPCSRVSGCCQALFSIVDGDNDFLARTKELLVDEARYAASNAVMNPRSILVECALGLSHEKNKSRIRVKELSEALNAALSGRGEDFQVSAKQVGLYLRDFGLPPREFHGVYVLELQEPVRRRIHEIAVSLDVPTVRKRTIHCPFCKEAWGNAAADDAPRSVQ